MDRRAGWADKPVPIACGQCIGCRLQRASDWTTRALHEAQMVRELEHRESSFVTLTYDDAHLPTDYGLQRRDLQLFFKRLRKRHRFRYLAVGEYGDTSRRPHYHALLFGLDFAEDRVEISRNQRGESLYMSEELATTWKNGLCSVGALTRESAAYVARYAIKKVNGPKAEEAYRRTRDGYEWQVAPEFIAASLKPGIGSSWLEKYRSDIYPRDKTIVNGTRVHTPRYYDKLLERRLPQMHQEVKTARARRARQASEALAPDRLEAFEVIQQTRQRLRRN